METILKKVSCHHCGEFCDKEEVLFEEKSFCCHSCKNVYLLLNRNGLDEFYRLNPKSGLRQKESKESKFNFLDSEDVLASVLSYSSENYSKVSIYVPEIYCSSCVWLMENLYRLNDAILESSVNLGQKKLFLAYNPQKVSLREIAELLFSLGYHPHFNEDSQLQKKGLFKKLYIQLAVAGFAFGNVMILSFPDYFGSGFENSEFRKVFPYISFLFSLPVFLYSAKDYFKSAYQNLIHRQVSMDVPISLGIIALFLRSSIDVFFLDSMGYFDSFCGFVFFILLGKLYQTKVFEHLSFEKEFKSFLPLSVERKKGKSFEHVLIEKLQKSDIIRLAHNEIVPCDSILLKDSTYFDYSFVTGESDLIEKKAGELVYSGGRVKDQAAEFRVEKVLDKSYLVQLWAKAKQEKRAERKESFVDQIAFRFTAAVIVIASSVFITTLSLGLSEALNRLSAVLIVACPCALALSTPFTYGSISSTLAKNGFFFKDALSIELFNRIKNFVFDKTGTLSELTSGKVDAFFADERQEKKAKAILAQSSHPLAKRIVDAEAKASAYELSSFEEVLGKGLRATIEGEHFLIGSKSFLSEEGVEFSQEETHSSEIYVAASGVYVGFFRIRLALRKKIEALFHFLNGQKDVKSYLLSGDNSEDRAVFERFFKNSSHIFFNQSPADKVQFIKELKSETAMFGDGMNDASALQQSLIGVSVIEKNSQFSPSSDAILKADELQKLPQFLELIFFGKKIVYLSIIFSFFYNIIGFYYAASGILTPLVSAILMPLSSVTIISIAVFSIFLKSKAMELN